MLSSALPPKFNIPFASNAGGAYIRPIPQPSQTAITPGAASLYDGFPPVTFQPISAGGVPPAGQDFNGLLNQVTKWSQWQAAGGQVFYDAAFAAAIGGYPRGAYLLSTTFSYFWLSIAENNSNNPDTGGAGWVQVVPATPSNATPTTNGTANAGTSLAFSRGDHVHPTDSSRAALAYVNATFQTIAVANASYLPIVNPTAQGTLRVNGNIVVVGDMYAYRAAAPATGVIFLNQSGNRYLYFDGTNYVMPGTDLYVNGTSMLAAAYVAGVANTNAIAAQNTADIANYVANAALGTFASYLPNLQQSNAGQRGFIYFAQNNFTAVSLPAGGTWFVYCIFFNGNGNAINSTGGMIPGGAQINNGTATSILWAIKVA